LKFKSKTTVIAVTDRGRSETPYRDFDCETEFADYIIGTKGNLFRKAFTRDPKRFFQIEWDWNQSVSQPVWLLCGVADPEELNRFYSSRGLVIQKLIVKPDHAEFDPLEVKKLMEDARSSGCVLAITGKDAVKLKEFTNDVLVLSRTIRNQDWIESIFKSTMN